MDGFTPMCGMTLRPNMYRNSMKVRFPFIHVVKARSLNCRYYFPFQPPPIKIVFATLSWRSGCFPTCLCFIRVSVLSFEMNSLYALVNCRVYVYLFLWCASGFTPAGAASSFTYVFDIVDWRLEKWSQFAEDHFEWTFGCAGRDLSSLKRRAEFWGDII